ncbi:MAG: copper amine oxidase N-terminal domain-containing protein [Clostridiales bacterium]|nr:copper amine oxidase N-terminal domain-containing protein [Clostridiales bacterium]
MGKLLKKGLALTLVLVMVISGGTFAFAQEKEDVVKDSLLMTIDELKAADYPEAPAQKPAVMLNGEYVAFTDANPANISGRVMVPFRAILEAMGAVVDYDKATKEISAVLGDKEISFYAGKPDINIVENGVESKITMDVVPFIDAYSQRTYVSTRFVAEAFGLSVGWDSDDKTVIIIDFKSMIPEIADKFEVLGMLFDTEDFDWEKNYKTEGFAKLGLGISDTIAQQLTGDLTKTGGEISFDMDIAGIQKGMTADVTVDMEADLSKLYEIIDVAGTPEEAYFEQLMTGLDIDVKMDDEAIYIAMPFLDYVMSEEMTLPEGDKVWYKIPLSFLYETYDEMGVDFEGLLNGVTEMTSLEDYLYYYVGMMEDLLSTETYLDTCAVVAVLEECMGDDAFKKSGNTYTLSMDNAWLAEKIALFGSESETELLDEWNTDGISFDIDLIIKATSAGKLSNYSLNGSVDLSALIGTPGSVFIIKSSGNNYKADAECVIAIPELFTVSVSTSESLTQTSKAPDVKIPSGDGVVDLVKFMEELEAQMPVDEM